MDVGTVRPGSSARPAGTSCWLYDLKGKSYDAAHGVMLQPDYSTYGRG